MNTGNEVKVWDPLVRVIHWALVAAFATAYFTDDEDFLDPHVWAGYVIIGLLLIRVIWGFVGTAHARFSDFIYAPSAVKAFLRDTLVGRAKRYLGHNPAGGWMIILMLIMITLISISGLMLYGADQHAGPLAGIMAGTGKGATEALEGLHEFCANFTVFLVLIHVAGVVMEGIQHKENLVWSMVTGNKRAGDAVPPAGANGSSYKSVLIAIGSAGLLLVMAAGGLPAEAGTAEVTDLKAPAGLLPLEKIIERARAQHTGHLIEAELKSLNGQPAYEIEFLDEGGKVWEMFFNAETGEIMKQGEEKGGEDTGR